MAPRENAGTICEPRRLMSIDRDPNDARLRQRLTRATWSLIVASLAVVCAATLMFASTISTAVHLTVNALIMTGTGTPNPSQGYVNAVVRDYINPATGGRYSGVAVSTPETVPLNASVAAGLEDLQEAMAQQQATNPGQPFAIFGFSQSTQIVIAEKRELSALKASGQPVPDVTLVMFGAGNRPNGGLLSRFPGLYIPIVGIEFDGAAPTDPINGIKSVDIARQYDFFGDVPTYPINLLADLNAVLGLFYVHNTIADGTTPLTGPFSDQYVEGSSNIVKQQQGDTTYYLIPTADLPLFGPLRALGVPEGLIDIVEPAVRVLVEAGYDRSIPMGQPTPAQLIPTIDPITFALELAVAIVQGANNAFALVGAELPGGAALENLLATASEGSAAVVGVPYHQVVSAINNGFNPITSFTQAEGPIAHTAEDVLSITGIPQILGAVAGLAISAIFGPIAAAAPVDGTPPPAPDAPIALAGETRTTGSVLSLSTPSPESTKTPDAAKSAESQVTPATTDATEAATDQHVTSPSSTDPNQSTTTAPASVQTISESDAAEPALESGSGTRSTTSDSARSTSSNGASSTTSGASGGTSSTTTDGTNGEAQPQSTGRTDKDANPRRTKDSSESSAGDGSSSTTEATKD